jgi:hypothetical protein
VRQGPRLVPQVQRRRGRHHERAREPVQGELPPGVVGGVHTGPVVPDQGRQRAIPPAVQVPDAGAGEGCGHAGQETGVAGEGTPRDDGADEVAVGGFGPALLIGGAGPAARPCHGEDEDHQQAEQRDRLGGVPQRAQVAGGQGRRQAHLPPHDNQELPLHSDDGALVDLSLEQHFPGATTSVHGGEFKAQEEGVLQ